MLESNLLPGSQKLTGNRADLKDGVSITDGCIGWDETEALILGAHRRLADAGT
jgi:3-deoxy-7-phosphoheptulonate synthase